VVATTGSHRTTYRTLLTGLVRIDLLDTNTSAFGFVRDELLELVEMPRVNAQPRTVLSDVFEVFHPNNGVLELFRERDEATASSSINARTESGSYHSASAESIVSWERSSRYVAFHPRLATCRIPGPSSTAAARIVTRSIAGCVSRLSV
jgi:hypothetical protein